MRHTNSVRNVILGLLLLGVVGCEFNHKVTLSLSQLLVGLTPGPKTAKFVKAEVGFQVTSKDECNKKKKEIKALLSAFYKNMQNLRCEAGESGMKTFAKFQTEIPLTLTKTPEPPTQKVLLGFYLRDLKKKGFKLGMSINPELFKKLDNSLKEKYFQNLKPENFKVYLTLKNDLRTPVKLGVSSSYVNGAAIALSRDVELKPKEKLTVHPSIILTHQIVGEGYYDILFIKMNPGGNVLPPGKINRIGK